MSALILGSGQLARMLTHAADRLGILVDNLDGQTDRYGTGWSQQGWQPAAQYSLVTYESEQIPLALARPHAERGALAPGLPALLHMGHRLRERELLQSLGLACAPWRPVEDGASLDAALATLGLPAVLKHPSLGYDGKSQWWLRQPSDRHAIAQQLDEQADEPWLLEAAVPFRRELSLVGVRSRTGELAFYPLVENLHKNGILHCTLAPAPDLTPGLQQTAERMLTRVLESLDYVGVCAMELFEVRGELWVNELAPRVHNSGHWSMDGALCSQFENHWRALLGWPLGSTKPRGVNAMINLIGQMPPIEPILALPWARFYSYHKQPRPGRKLGHVNLLANSAEERELRLQQLLPLIHNVY